MGIDDLIFRNSTDAVDRGFDPIQIFNYVDKKEGFGYLRTNQADFLKEWNLRREERDIVGIMHTGAGKTLVGLLMLQSKLIEEKKPAIYLCPTRQLVQQTIRQAENYGIGICEIDTNDGCLPTDFLNSEKILVTTFSKLFNGKSIFGVKAFSTATKEIGSILIDDAHACVEYARQSSTISIPRDSDAFNKLFSLFSKELERQSRGKYNSIKNKKEDSVCMQVPYWEWIDKIADVGSILDERFSEISVDNDYSYRMIIDILEFSRCYISGEKIDIVPKYTPVEQIPSFFHAKHRYILSATINTKDLREDLGIERSAIENPIVTKTYVADVGERMILSPTKYHKDITDSMIRKWFYTVSKKENLGLVVIVPSYSSYAIKEWRDLGATIIDKNNAEFILDKIRSGDKLRVVLVNRYEGIDFPGDQSHMLILDGLPNFSTNKDKVVSITSQNENLKLKIVQKLEQGMGRTVRSNSDYSVVILLGNYLVNFVSLKENIKYFSLATQVQLQIGNKMIASFDTVGSAKDEIAKSLNYCLGRNDTWIKFAKDELAKVDITKLDNRDISAIDAEYLSYWQYAKRNYREAIKNLETVEPEADSEKGRIYQEKAEIMHSIGEMKKSENLQSLARKKWDYAYEPKTNKMQKELKNSDTVKECLKHINNFADKASLNNFVNKIIEKLNYDNSASSDLFEEAIADLGRLLGVHSTRPEKDRGDGGPDNLWIANQAEFVIECKNRECNKISKKDVAQLIHSQQWFKNNYGKTPKLVLFHALSDKEKDVQVSENMFVVSSKKLEKLKQQINEFCKLVYENFEDLTKDKVYNYLQKSQLNLNQFEQNFFEKL